MSSVEELSSGLRAAVKSRLDATPADDPKMVGYKPSPLAGCLPAAECAAQVLGSIMAPPKSVGTTAKFGTGAVRSSTFEEYRYDLVSPIGLREVARACAEGAEKYGDWNWERGMPVHDLLNHALAHVYSFLSGDRSEPHLGHAAWNLLAAIHSHELWPHLNQGHLRGDGCVCPDSEARRA